MKMFAILTGASLFLTACSDDQAKSDMQPIQILDDNVCVLLEGESPEAKAKRLEECEQSKKRERERERKREQERDKSRKDKEQQVFISEEWRERRQAADPDQYSQLSAQCEAETSRRYSEQQRVIDVTDCMRLAWKSN